MQEIVRPMRRALAALAAAGATAASAVELQDAQVRSALGEPLDARIPFTLSPGESVDASCFALVLDPADGPAALAEGILTIERRRGQAALRLRTVAPVMEPNLTARVRAACPGGEARGSRLVALRAAAASGATPGAVELPAIAAQLRARSGDTLESMAATVYPREGEARRRYLTGLRRLNPSLTDTPIPEGTPVALPDPRTIHVTREQTRIAATPAPRAGRETAAQASPPARPSRRLARAPASDRAPAAERTPGPSALAEAPKMAPVAAPKREPKAGVAAPERRADAPERTTRRAPQAQHAPGSPFVLKLSSGEVDLSRSRNIDDRMRAQLRERLTILDADDQVAAMLSMRHSLKQLEARVAEMQLKLDSMPASLAARPPPSKPEPPPVVAEPPKVETPKVEAPKPGPPKVEAKAEPAKVEVPKVEAPKPEPPKVEAPKPEPPKVEPPKPAPPKVEASPPKVVEPKVATRPVKGTAKDDAFALPDWLWAVAALFLVAAAALAWWVVRRRRAGAEDMEHEDAAEVAHGPATQSAPAPVAVPPADEPIEVAQEMRPQVGSDAVLATRLPENARELRRRYIEERFPEIENRTIVLDDPSSVVKGARLFYQDGAMPRAVELLQYVIEEKPEEVRPWLALFEIFRLERLTGEYAQLAERFRQHHGKGDTWRKVQFFGRENDPGNALYREEPLNTLETIGPREARRLAAGLSSVGASGTFDPIAENWLEAPMDFENEVLSNELRMKVMAQASLTEQDLQPNPMPALRNIEMFTVA